MRSTALTRGAAALGVAALLGSGFATSAGAADPAPADDRIQGPFTLLDASQPTATGEPVTLEGIRVGADGALVAEAAPQEKPAAKAETFELDSPQWKQEVAADVISAPAPGTSGIVRFEDGAGAGQCLGADMASLTDCATAPDFAWAPAAGAGTDSELAVLVDAEGAAFTQTPGVTATATAAEAGAAGFNLSLFSAPSLVWPTARIDSGTDGLVATFDGTGSTAPKGQRIVSYRWTFGDGTTSTSASPTHTYTSAGHHLVTLTVKTNRGKIDTTATTIHVAGKPSVAPVAVIDVTTDGLTAAFSGADSRTAEGTITSYAWDFGDGTTATGVAPAHAYAAAGTYTVALTVTNSLGVSASATTTVAVAPAPPAAPTADMVISIDGLDVAVDGSASTATAGRTLTAYDWDFGDGATGTGTRATHTYAAAGTYLVTLTVTDSAGATATTTTRITVMPPKATGPTAVIDVSTSELKGLFSAARSTSAANTPIVSYAWNFGDGATNAAMEATHVYPASGTYTVSLTVTDAAGQSSTATTSVTLTAKSPLVYDTWGRTSTNSWGTANVGGTWLKTDGLAIEGAGVGTMTFDRTGTTIQTYLNRVSVLDADVTFDVSFDSTTGGYGTMFGSIVRKSDEGNYRVKLVATQDGVMTVSLVRYIGTTEAFLASAPLPDAYVPGQVLRVRFQAVGSGTTTLRAKAWPTGTREPNDWLVTTTDSTPQLQAPGYVGFTGYVSSQAPSANGQKIRVDNYRIVTP